MQTLQDNESEYRKVYAFIARTFTGQRLDDFLENNERLDAPPILGAQSVEVGPWDRVDRFEEGELVHAQLSDGQPVILPYRDFVQRWLQDYGTPMETEWRESQRAVDYDELDETAQAAVEEAWRAEAFERHREETLPHYKRLALSPDPTRDSGGRLHTVKFRTDYNRILHRYPDHHGFYTSDTEPQLDNPVTSARAVSNSYLVVPLGEAGLGWTTYRDPEPNFFGPRETEANAFWIAGDPRVVVDRSGSPKVMTLNERGDAFSRPKWVIIPVRYYQVEEQRQESGHDDDFRPF